MTPSAYSIQYVPSEGGWVVYRNINPVSVSFFTPGAAEDYLDLIRGIRGEH